MEITPMIILQLCLLGIAIILSSFSKKVLFVAKKFGKILFSLKKSYFYTDEHKKLRKSFTSKEWDFFARTIIIIIGSTFLITGILLYILI